MNQVFRSSLGIVPLMLAGCVAPVSGPAVVENSAALVPHDPVHIAAHEQHLDHIAIANISADVPAIWSSGGAMIRVADSAISAMGDMTAPAPRRLPPAMASEGTPPMRGPDDGDGGRPPLPPAGMNGNGLRPGGPAPGAMPPAEGGMLAEVCTHSAGVFAAHGSAAILRDVDIVTALSEGKALCAVGVGAQIALKGGHISTQGPSSHGVFATQGGEVTVEQVSIATSGAHSSALATDQGGGTVTVHGGEYVATGAYSAALYSTGDIRVSGGEFRSYRDNVAVVEGGSHLTIGDADLWAATKGAVMMYQSFSGDADVGTSTFHQTGGSIRAEAGPLFYITNTRAAVTLSDVRLNTQSGLLVLAAKGDWGVDDPNAHASQGGRLTLTALTQVLPGDIDVDDFGRIDVALKDHSTLVGRANPERHLGRVNMTLDASSRWQLTGDSTVGELILPAYDAKAIQSQIQGDGNNVFYDPLTNPQLAARQWPLGGGGFLTPQR